MLEDAGQTRVQIVAEARGSNEDNALRLTFLDVVTNGTGFITARRFKATQFDLTFLPKSSNILGTQMADLVGYPVARYVINPAVPNPAYTIVVPKFSIGRGMVRGLKVFP